jgi:hypothetical protein
MSILRDEAPRVHSGREPATVRTEVADEQRESHPAGSGQVVIPPSRRSLAEIQADDGLSNGAKLLARYLDGLCLSHGKWAAWPKVSTIAHVLGWGGEPRAFRKRVERAFRELIESGDVTRPRLGELVAWYDAEGAGKGLGWPKGLRRNLFRSAAICVLGWKVAEAEASPPILTACDIPVASSNPAEPSRAAECRIGHPGNVASDTPEMSHPTLNVRNLNVRTEPTLNVAALAGPGEGDAGTAVEAIAAEEGAQATVEPSDPARAATPTRESAWTDRELAEKLVRRFRDRGLYPRIELDPAGLEIIRIDRRNPSADFLPGERDELARLRPHVLAYLNGRTGPVPPVAEGSDDAAGPPSRRVPDVVQAEVRALVGRLAGNADPAIEAKAARGLADALADHNPESLAFFSGLAGSVRRGELAEACLQGAFEAACGRKVRNRGAMFTSEVNRWIHANRSGRPTAGGAP